MPKNPDFKRLIRARMEETGERYTAARAALADPPDVLTPRTRSLLGQLADVSLAGASHLLIEKLPDDERRAAALEGLKHSNWRVRRTSAQMLDRVDLTPASLAALTRALDDEHPAVRRKAVHSLACEHCKPNGCVADVRPLFERAIRDAHSEVRSMVVHVCSLHFFDRQWAVDLVASVAAADASAKLRQVAVDEIEGLRAQWDSDAQRRRLPGELVSKTERHRGRWIAIQEGRIVAVRNGQARVFRRAVLAGATPYWVAPEGLVPPQLP